MSEPLKFPKQAQNEFHPHPKVIKLLEDTLALAKEGKIQAVGVAVVYHDSLDSAGETSSTWAMNTGTKFGLSHAILVLQAEWAKAVLDAQG